MEQPGAATYLTWPNFARLIDEGVPALQPIPGTPALELFVEEKSRRIGMYAGASALEPLPSLDYAEVELAWVERHGQPYLEIATSSVDLFREFYSFLLVIADLIHGKGASPLTAVVESLGRWSQLLAPFQLLSEEVQTGLVGELWLLRRLINCQGTAGLDAWIGPRGELHDFRLQDRDIEVKTTRANRRIHVISGLEQLESRDGRPLFLLSLRISEAGQLEGFSISSIVTEVRAMLSANAQRLDTFNWLLKEGVGYVEGQAAHYEARFVLADQARLIAVDAGFPRLISENLLGLPPEARPRIDQVRYRIHVEGMGDEDGQQPFMDLIP